MGNFLTGLLVATIVWCTILGCLVVDYQREYRRVEVEAYQSCQDARDRAYQFGRERSALYREIGRLKR